MSGNHILLLLMLQLITFKIISAEEILYETNPLNNTNTSKSNFQNKLKRGKRYLDFVPKSRMFFRANVKDNLIKVNQLWAHAFGFRANYPIENDKEHRPFRRDVYETMEHLMNHHGFDGKACVLKSYCEASKSSTPKSGILFKLFKLIFRLQDKDRKLFPYLKEENCMHLLHQHCPLSLNNISPFTDL